MAVRDAVESAAFCALLDRHRALWQRGEHGSFLRVSTQNPQSLPVGDDLIEQFQRIVEERFQDLIWTP